MRLLAALLIGLPSCAAQVVVNEVLGNPDAPNTEEWAEIYNAGAATVDVSGWQISDDRGHGATGAVTLAAGATLGAGARLVVVLRDSDGYLNNGGDGVQLHDASAALIDSVSWTAAFGGDLALARQPDGGSWATGWVAPTRDAANAAAAAAGGSSGLGASLAASP